MCSNGHDPPSRGASSAWPSIDLPRAKVRLKDEVQMSADAERNLGEQPIARIMAEQGLKAHNLVAASTEQITHKMVSKACKGRRLTPNIQAKVLKALNNCTKGSYTLADLFNY